VKTSNTTLRLNLSILSPTLESMISGLCSCAFLFLLR
jgi:hypothetical protein